MRFLYQKRPGSGRSFSSGCLSRASRTTRPARRPRDGQTIGRFNGTNSPMQLDRRVFATEVKPDPSCCLCGRQLRGTGAVAEVRIGSQARDSDRTAFRRRRDFASFACLCWLSGSEGAHENDSDSLQPKRIDDPGWTLHPRAQGRRARQSAWRRALYRPVRVVRRSFPGLAPRGPTERPQ
jgi:hypothetical protein